jgi:hypothetical protein
VRNDATLRTRALARDHKIMALRDKLHAARMSCVCVVPRIDAARAKHGADKRKPR